MSRIDAYRYQVVLLGDSTFLQSVYQDLQQQLEDKLAELSIDHKLVRLLVSEKASEIDYSLPVVGLYFGGAAWEERFETDSPVLQSLLDKGITVLPVVNSSDRFRQNVPKELHPVNAMRLGSGTSEERLASVLNFILQEFHLLRHHRKVFISYCREDALTQAMHLYDTLSAHGFNVFLDTHSISKGIDFQQELKHQLMDADMMVALHTDNYMSRDWVKEELNEASVLQIGVIELLCTDQGDGQAGKSIPGSLGLPIIMKKMDLLCPVRYQEIEEKIALAVERFLARSLQARISNLMGPFISWLKKENLSYTLHPSHVVYAEEQDKRILFVPAIGIPDAKVMDDARLWIQEYLQDEAGRQEVKVCLVYDQLYMKKKWMEHLQWLDGYLPVKTVCIRELDSYSYHHILEKWKTN